MHGVGWRARWMGRETGEPARARPGADVTLTALIVDDEPLARRRLASLLADVPWATQVGEAADGIEALEAIEQLSPHVVFLDVQIPELSGVQVAAKLRDRAVARSGERLQASPVVVFTTAYDAHALAAFELGAVDYLLKPFGTRRFLEALEKAQLMSQAKAGGVALERAIAALGAGGSISRDRIFVRAGNEVLPLPLHEVERIEAQGDYAMIHTQDRQHLVNLRTSVLESRLPNPPFLRVHRSHIVNLDHVARISGLDDSRFEVRMKSGALVPVSRTRSQELRRRSR
jgi:two-component system, LytTR family, response regulator